MSKIRLEDLLSRCTPENRHEEVNFDSPSVTDLLANLARRVASLEQQLSATQGNLEKLAEELANTKHHAYSIERDVMEVEKQTEVLHAIRLFYERGRR
jgi:phage shock protein A